MTDKRSNHKSAHQSERSDRSHDDKIEPNAQRRDAPALKLHDKKREHGGKNISEVLKFMNVMTWNLQIDKRRRRNKKSMRRRRGRKWRKRFNIRSKRRKEQKEEIKTVEEA